jgi:hypothetical protein
MIWGQTFAKSQTFRILAIAAVIYAIYLPVAFWLDRPIVAPKGKLVIRLTPIQPAPRYGGFAYETPLTEFRQFEEYSGQKFVPSPIRVYEGDKPLGPPVHGDLTSIASNGTGRYSHWNGEGLIFSTSDNSDPRKNGRTYWAVVPY